MTDRAIEVHSHDGSGRLIKVSIETDQVSTLFDGPMHYHLPAMESRDRVGLIDAKTRIRNALLMKCINPLRLTDGGTDEAVQPSTLRQKDEFNDRVNCQDRE